MTYVNFGQKVQLEGDILLNELSDKQSTRTQTVKFTVVIYIKYRCTCYAETYGSYTVDDSN